jgi:hypothetical protein
VELVSTNFHTKTLIFDKKEKMRGIQKEWCKSGGKA